MSVHISDHFTYKRLFRAVLPSIFMMVFTSIYSIVDGLFVSNFVGKTAFAGLNLIYPVTMIIGAIGFMLGAGGSALVSKTLGEGKKERANKIFSMLVIFTLILGISVSLLLFFFVKPIAKLLGATPEMLPYCTIYGKILIGGEVFFMLQNLFQSFFITAERPILGFLMSIIAGVINMALDATLIVGFNLGIKGAAIATISSQFIGAIIPLIYFLSKNKSLLRLQPTKLEFGVLLKSTTNGSSELLSNIAASVLGMIYNFQLLKFAGENGVAAYGVILYLAFIFSAIFIGYAIGTAPIVGYNYGAKNSDELKNILKKSIIITIIFGLTMTVFSQALASPMSRIFVSYDKELLSMTTNAMRIYSICFLIMGFNMFVSSFFTALNNGLVSAILSFLRTLVFQTSAVFVLPLIFGLNGIWSAVIIAEFFTLLVELIFLITNKKKYNY